MFPDALVIGPMKAGTTWLHEYLASRGNICLPSGVKETFFFDCHFDKGDKWYQAHFRHHDPQLHRLTLEVAPSYFHCPDAPTRIASILGQIPLIVILRDPVSRSWSHYLHLLRYGYTRAPLREAAEQFPAVIKASCYAEMLARWWEVFGRDRVNILLYQTLVDNPAAFAEQLCTILNLKYEGFAEENVHRSNAAATAPSPWLASLGRNVANILRGQRLYFLINAAKRVGLKPIFFGRPGHGYPVLRLADDDQQWLTERLRPEIEEIHGLLGSDLDRRFPIQVSDSLK